MDFKTGISPLTYKSIMEHLDICSENISNIVDDIYDIPSSDIIRVEYPLRNIQAIAMATLLVASSWADERRELSKIVNRPTV